MIFEGNERIHIGGFSIPGNLILGVEIYKYFEDKSNSENNLYKVIILLNHKIHQGKVLLLSRKNLLKALYKYEELVEDEKNIEEYIDSLEYHYVDVMEVKQVYLMEESEEDTSGDDEDSELLQD